MIRHPAENAFCVQQLQMAEDKVAAPPFCSYPGTLKWTGHFPSMSAVAPFLIKGLLRALRSHKCSTPRMARPWEVGSLRF